MQLAIIFFIIHLCHVRFLRTHYFGGNFIIYLSYILQIFPQNYPLYFDMFPYFCYVVNVFKKWNNIEEVLALLSLSQITLFTASKYYFIKCL